MTFQFSKFVFVAGMIGASTSVAAQSAPYVGLMAGWDDVNTEFTTSVSSAKGLSVSGAGGSIIAGIEIPMPNGFINVEASVNDSSAEYVQESGTSALSMAKNIGYGADVLFGAYINHTTALFGSLGYALSDIEVSVDDSSLGLSSSEERFGGFRVGLGLQAEITELVSARAHWTRSFYSEENISFNNNPNTFEVRPKGSMFSIGVIARF